MKRSPKLDVRADHLKVVSDILRKLVPAQDVWAFGSRVKGTAKKFSDLDLAIISEKPLSLEISASLSDSFSECDLPYKVDVVDWATTSESFRKIIEQNKVVIQKGEGSPLVTAPQGGASTTPLSGGDPRHAPERKTVKLGQACLKIGSGATPRGGKDAYKGGDTALIRSQNIYNHGFTPNGLVYIDDSQAEELRNVVIKEGDVLLNITGDSVARCCQVPSSVLPARVNQHVAIIRTNPEILDSKYLRYVMVSSAFQNHLLALASAGATRDALTKSMIEVLEVDWIPIREQKAIANILGNLDDKIENNRCMNETLEAMARALFKDWFVDFGPVRAKMEGREPPGLSAEVAGLFPESLVDSVLGEIPDGWAATTLQHLTSKIGSGSTPRGGKDVYKTEGIAFIRSQNVYDSQFIWDGLAWIDSVQAKSLENVSVQQGDVLLNITGASILRTCVVEPSVLPARVNQHVAIIRANPEIPNHFLHQHLLLGKTKEYLLGMNAGASREAVTKSHIESVPIVKPNSTVLEEFRSATDPWFRRIENNTVQNRSLSSIRDLLLPKLLSGDVRVYEAENLVGAIP